MFMRNNNFLCDAFCHFCSKTLQNPKKEKKKTKQSKMSRTAILRLNQWWGRNSARIDPTCLTFNFIQRFHENLNMAGCLVPNDSQNATPHINLNGNQQLFDSINMITNELQFLPGNIVFKGRCIQWNIGNGIHITLVYFKQKMSTAYSAEQIISILQQTAENVFHIQITESERLDWINRYNPPKVRREKRPQSNNNHQKEQSINSHIRSNNNNNNNNNTITIDDNNDEKQSDSIQEVQICKICFVNKINCHLMPCGHVTMCMVCAEPQMVCPLCRIPITQKNKCFL